VLPAILEVVELWGGERRAKEVVLVEDVVAVQAKVPQLFRIGDVILEDVLLTAGSSGLDLASDRFKLLEHRVQDLAALAAPLLVEH